MMFSRVLVAFPVCLLLCFGNSPLAISQDPSTSFEQAGALFKAGDVSDALEILRELEQVPDLDESLKKDIRWAHISALTGLARSARFQEDWATAKKLTDESLECLNNPDSKFSADELETLNVKKIWAYKNMIVACHGLDELDEAKSWRDKLYEGYRNKSLPNGIDNFFNFDFFRHERINVWGYEYYPRLGDPETDGSFSKFVYHIYTAKDDGTDDEQLYLLHALKFHKFDDAVKFDYVLTKRWMDEGAESSSTYAKYTYTEPVDIKKLRRDIREFIQDPPEPDFTVSRGIEPDDQE